MQVVNLPESVLIDLGIKSAKRLQYLKRIYGVNNSIDYHYYDSYYHGNFNRRPASLSLDDSAVLIQATNDVHNEIKKTFEPELIEWSTKIFESENHPEATLWSLYFKDSKKYAEVVAAQRKIMLDKIRSNS
jgi:hypothetical protein